MHFHGRRRSVVHPSGLFLAATRLSMGPATPIQEPQPYAMR
jgi:hypothetical protein